MVWFLIWSEGGSGCHFLPLPLPLGLPLDLPFPKPFGTPLEGGAVFRGQFWRR